MRIVPGSLVLAALALAASACGGDGALRVEDAWVRAPMPDAGAVYLVVANDGDVDDALTGAVCEGAGRAEVHETSMEDGQAMMRPVASVAVPAGERVALEPGGFHVMLFDLDPPLRPGGELSCELTFERAGILEIVAEVRDVGEMGEMADT